MVVINLTMAVELGLFLIFLWGTAVFILRPVLRSLDARAEQIEKDHDQARVAREEAATAGQEYSLAMSQLRAKVEASYRLARREARDEQSARVAAERKKADAAVLDARAQAAQEVEGARSSYDALSVELTDLLGRRLGVGGKPS